MMPTTPMQFFLDQGNATVRALSSLTRRDAAAVRATARAAGGFYAVEEHDDYDGYLSILLTLVQDGASAFLISGRTGAVDIAAVRGDDMIARGTFASIGAAMLALRPLLEARAGSAPRPRDAATRAEALVKRHGADAAIHAAMRVDASGREWRGILRAVDDLAATSKPGPDPRR